METKLVTKEAFSYDGKDYPRGSSITDASIIAVVEKEFPRHFVRVRASVVPSVGPSTVTTQGASFSSGGSSF